MFSQWLRRRSKHCITLHCIALHWVTSHCIGLIPILGWGQTSGAHSGKQSSGWSNGFPLADAAKVDRDGSTRQLDVFHYNVKDMRLIIIIIIIEDLNTRECVTAIEDQYNFCIKRADLRQKCTPEKSLELHKCSGGWGRPSWNVLRLQHTHRPPQVQNWSGFHVSQTSRWLVQVGLGCREEEGWRGNYIARGSSKDGFRGRQLSPVFCIAVGVNLSNICSYVFGNPI